MKRSIPAIIIVVGLGLLYPMQRWMDEQMPKAPVTEESLYFSSGQKLKKMSLGLEALTADIYWIRAVQYFGNKVLESQYARGSTRDLNLKLLAPLLNIITELDPHHIPAYRFGAIFLPERDMPAAIALVERGIQENPNYWRLYQDLGYIYWQAREYDKAAEAYERGGQIADAAWWMRDMAGFMRIKGGSRETAKAIYETYLESDDQKIRDQATARLKQLTSLDELEVINAWLERYKQETGRCPDNLKVFAGKFKSAGLTINENSLPVDPDGYVYIVDPAFCKALLALDSTIPRE